MLNVDAFARVGHCLTLSHPLLVLSPSHPLAGLQLLSLSDHDSHRLQFQSASACTALTASSKLCSLLLGVQAPQGALQHCFTQGRQLPYLISLLADSPHRFNRDDLQSIAVCCPSLRSLYLWHRDALPPAAAAREGGCDPSPLLQLHHLTYLTLQYVDDVAAGQLARLTQLQELKLLHPTDISDVGLLRLTSLTALKYLSVYQSSPGAALMGPGGHRLMSLESKVRSEGRGQGGGRGRGGWGGREGEGEGRWTWRGRKGGREKWKRRWREGRDLKLSCVKTAEAFKTHAGMWP